MSNATQPVIAKAWRLNPGRPCSPFGSESSILGVQAPIHDASQETPACAASVSTSSPSP
jgi:hypothetical protein